MPEIYVRYGDERLHHGGFVDHELMRYALMSTRPSPLRRDVTTYMVNTLLLTTDVVMEHKERRRGQELYQSGLCEITEDLVLTEPSTTSTAATWCLNQSALCAERLYDDKKLHWNSQIKFDFMNNAQALLHGDLHGFIFVGTDPRI